ncbi:MAG: tRNA lysidine(34) synthetase TilS [Flavobacteriaceae bacterium]|nr:tRNA lysidine(34) synthetase TilS [Flavobacteriaceae bacterium]
MLAQFSQHINSYFSFLKDKKLLIAISAGIDSVVLLHLLHSLKFNISLAHCNFQLRGKESDKDEAFVRKLAKELKVPIFTQSFETAGYANKQKLSIQLAARELRYKWFEEVLKINGLDFVLTAHHADDDLETFLINTTRGTGLDGLTGIPERNGNILRPLLPFSRTQIEQYAKEKGITWREDQTNLEINYLRNKIRHKIIPVLKEINPALLSSFKTTLENLKGSRQIIDDKISELSNDLVIKDGNELKLDIDQITKLSNPKAYLFELLKPYGFTEWNDVRDLLDAQSGKKILSSTHQLVKDRKHLLLVAYFEDDKNKGVYKVKKGDLYFHEEDIKMKFTYLTNTHTTINNNNVAFLDLRNLKFPLTVRKWEKGDYFYPLGMKGKKKLSKYFKDEKISILDKEKIWLLCSEDQVAWVVGKRLDDRFRITDKTKNILKIEKL